MILIIVAVALLPVLILGWWIYKKDSLRPEPLRMLYKAFFYGVGSTCVSLLISTLMNFLGLFTYDLASFKGAVSTALFAAAIPEEIAKLTMLWIFLRNNPYYDEYFEGRSGHDAFLEYYESILENLHAYKGFDVYGHLDYALRYAPNKGYTLDYKEFGDILDAILTEIVDSGLGIELNTAGLRFGMNHPNPHEDVIRRYRELGGDIITVGSDAHSPESIGYAFHKVKDILTECGFTHYNVFHGREAVYIPL